MTSVQSYVSNHSGANYAKLTVGDEDDDFHRERVHPEDPNDLTMQDVSDTLFSQRWSKISPFYPSHLIQKFTGTRLGSTQTVNLSKIPDYIGNLYFVVQLPGLKRNPANKDSKSACYVNAVGLYYHASTSFKISNQTLFTIDGQLQFALLDFNGLLDKYAKNIGYCHSIDELKAFSSENQTLNVPSIGFPSFNRIDLCLPPMLINYHPFIIEQLTRSPQELLLNLDGCKFTGRGSLALPLQISGAPFDANSLEFSVASNNYFVGEEERESKKAFPQQQMFKYSFKVGSVTVSPNENYQKVNVDLNIRGPITEIFAKVRSVHDIESGNWTKQCRDDGRDYIKTLQPLTGGMARNDGHEAAYYRTITPLENYKRNLSYHTYLTPFEIDSTSKAFTGQQNFTNVDHPVWSCIVEPHSEVLEIEVYATGWNSFWQRGGYGGMN